MGHPQQVLAALTARLSTNLQLPSGRCCTRIVCAELNEIVEPADVNVIKQRGAGNVQCSVFMFLVGVLVVSRGGG